MKVTLECKHCLIKFEISFKKRKAQFCSRQCAYASRLLPDFDKICKECNQSFRARAKKSKFCSKKCAALNYSKTFQHSEETKQLFSRNKKGKPTWNKGKTSHEDSRILAGNLNSAYGKTYRTKETHPEWADKIQKSTKGKVNLGLNNGMKNPEVAKRMAATRKKVLEDPQKRKEMSDRIKKAWADGKFDNVKVGRCKWYSHVKPDGKEIKVQGTWELAFVQWLDSQSLKYISHRGRISYTNENGDKKSYYPDFFIIDWQEWVDIKNEYHLFLQETKFSCIRKSNPDLKLKILKKSDLINLGIDLKNIKGTTVNP